MQLMLTACMRIRFEVVGAQERRVCAQVQGEGKEAPISALHQLRMCRVVCAQ